MIDIVERLMNPSPSVPAMRDGAAEILRMRAEIERLRAAVDIGMSACEVLAGWCDDGGKNAAAVLWRQKADIARAVLPSPPTQEGGG